MNNPELNLPGSMRLHGIGNPKSYMIIENENMTVPGNPIKIDRTWSERLFSFPWNPFRTTKWITPREPSKEVIIGPGGAMVMHPQTAHAFLAEIDARRARRHE